MSIKVCFIAPKAYPLFNQQILQTFGGAEVQLYLLAIELAKHKEYGVVFMVGDYGQPSTEDLDGVQVYRSIDQRTGMLRQGLTFFRTFNRINADAYVQRTLTPFSGLLAWYCCKRGKRYIYMVSSDPEVTGTHNVYRHPFYRFFISLLWKYSDQIIAQSEFQQAKLDERGIPSRVLLSSYPIPKIRSKDPRREYHLWVGRSTSVKRPEIFIELAQRIPSQKFVMVCPKATGTSDRTYQKLTGLASSLPNLRFDSFVPFNQIDRYYQGARALINTSNYEGFPNTFVHAAICQTPIISLSVNPDDFLNRYQCGIVCKGDFELLVSEVEGLLKDVERYNKLCENIYQYALNNHAIDKNIHQFISIINPDS